MRLQKILAQAGYGSRRSCEELITAGRVAVNGAVISRLGSRADPSRDRITVDGEKVSPEKKIYLVLNKPPGYLCTSIDRRGGKIVGDLLSGIRERVYTVGRLDRDSEGLLILTNDGDFAQRIAHPRCKVEKTYEVWTKGAVPERARKRLERGVWIEGKKTLPARIRGLRAVRGGTRLTIAITEGRKRQVKKMFRAVGSRVERLRRVAIGGLRLGDLPAGKYRRCDVRALETAIGLPPAGASVRGGAKCRAAGALALLLVLASSAAAALPAGEGTRFPCPGKITTDRVNVRAGKSLNYEIIAKLNEGDRVTVLGSERGWWSIVPPEGVSFWVSKRFIEDGKVSCGRLNVRARPTVRSTVISQLRRGDDVDVIEEKGEWAAIAPPGDARLWVSSELIELTPGTEAVARVAKVEEPGPKEPAAALEKEFPRLEEPPRPCSYEGRLARVEAVTVPEAAHKLERGAFFWKKTLCLITSQSINIDYFTGDRVGVWGHEVGRAPSGLPVVDVKRLEVR